MTAKLPASTFRCKWCGGIAAHAGTGTSGTKRYRNYKCKCGHARLNYSEPVTPVEEK